MSPPKKYYIASQSIYTDFVTDIACMCDLVVELVVEMMAVCYLPLVLLLFY